ncbi:hypothetical protein QD357_25115 [Rhizobium sp. BR 317]|uniref:hypothetical protein n=1 Tax=Rhizobium sp. BR 317 TaxID=3040015 RepID=UPI0039BF11C6
MITLRYELKKNDWNGYWSINDVFTGQPVVVDGHVVDCLTKDEAEYLMECPGPDPEERPQTSAVNDARRRYRALFNALALTR